MTATFATLVELDADLQRGGHLPLTPWWRAQMERFYAHPSARTYVGQVGRGGAKSHTSAKVGLNETLFGDWHVPAGERHYWAYVSKSKDEAGQRLLLLQSFLRALGIGFDVSGDEIALRDMPRGFRVFACQVGAVSGFRCYGYSADELAKWQAGVERANPAAEVCASLNAMCITHPGARRLLISSPFGMLDYHYDRYELGDTGTQLVANAPSWVANPEGITEEQTRAAETDDRVWRREYLAEPQLSVNPAFPYDVVTEAFRDAKAELDVRLPGYPFGLDDVSSGRRDAWPSMVARFWVDPPEPEFLTKRQARTLRNGERIEWQELLVDRETGRPIPNPAFHEPRPALLVVENVMANEGSFWQSLPANQLVAQRAKFYLQAGVRTVFGDQREGYLVQAAYAAHGLNYVQLPWTASNKPAAVERLRRWLVERLILLPDHPKLKQELLAFRERVLPSGNITFDAASGAHDDFVACLVTCALAELEGLLPSSPLSQGKEQREQRRRESHAHILQRFGFDANIDEDGRLIARINV